LSNHSDPSASGQVGGSPPEPEDDATAALRQRARREIRFEHSPQFVPILSQLGGSLLVSTYAAGKVVTIGTGPDGLRLAFSNFRQAMGIALGVDRLAIGGPNLIWILRDAEQLASRIDPPGRFDRGFLTRESFVTGNIHVHEMGWGRDGELWVVNTLFSCLCTLHEDFNFVPRWQPPFVDAYAPEDRCHLNGLWIEDGRPRLVTALGTSNEPRGWRESKHTGGVLIDVDSGAVIARGFCMPHSPRVYQGSIVLLDSGRGRLIRVDPANGQIDTITEFPGYGRGMAIHGQFAFIGMSRARETSVFGGVPICDDRSKMRCGVVVVDLVSGSCVAYLEFKTGVEELFDVQVVPGSRSPVICGPYPTEDEQVPVWVIPNPTQVGELLDRSTPAGVSRKRIR
jgi:uncharacterized protein (TIGR03032 family)